MNNLKISKTFLLSLAFLLVCLLAGTLFCGCSDGSVTEKPPPTATSTPSPTPTATVTTETASKGESATDNVGTAKPEVTPDAEATPGEDNELTFPPEWGDWLEPATSADSTATPAKSTPKPTPTKSTSVTDGTGSTNVSTPTKTPNSTITLPTTSGEAANPENTETPPTSTPTDVDGLGWSGWYS